jgi:hypothetical protein
MLFNMNGSQKVIQGTLLEEIHGVVKQASLHPQRLLLAVAVAEAAKVRVARGRAAEVDKGTGSFPLLLAPPVAIVLLVWLSHASTPLQGWQRRSQKDFGQEVTHTEKHQPHKLLIAIRGPLCHLLQLPLSSCLEVSVTALEETVAQEVIRATKRDKHQIPLA